MEYYTIEVFSSFLTSKKFWQQATNEDGTLYTHHSLDDKLLEDCRTARKAYGAVNVRIVKVVRTVIAATV